MRTAAAANLDAPVSANECSIGAHAREGQGGEVNVKVLEEVPLERTKQLVAHRLSGCDSLRNPEASSESS